jgi:hypothetical protein
MRRMIFLPVLLAAFSGAVFADAGDPPARVARLNYISGSVSFRPGSVEEWAAATPNYPMTTGDHLWADEGAGAEMHVGSTAIRLASSTALEFLNLDDRVTQFSIRQGALNIHLRRLDDDQTFEIDTPNAAISLLRAGEYRIDVSPDDATTYVTVRGGEANVTGTGNPFTVHAREMARIAGDPPAYDINAVRPPDGWDEWCLDRDRREEEAARVSARYVPPEMVGYEDLGSYGAWRDAPGYGMVWAPRVAVGWAPYHHGHWAWVEPWGWTWIDDAPWGFAPFHYGRWAFFGGGWVWVPGAIVARPVYAPALVAFVGGPHFSLSIGIGGGMGAGVAWFPLGPREVYVPAYHVSPTYVRQVNITHVTNITNVNVTNVNVTNVHYVNQTVPGAVTAVPRNAFVTARPVAQSAVTVNSQMLARGEVAHNAPFAPTRASVLGGASPASALPPAAIQSRAVVARTTPPPPPVPFAVKQQALETNAGRPLDQSQINTLRPAFAAAHPAVRTIGQNGRPAPVVQPAAQPSQAPYSRTQQQPANVNAAPTVIRPGFDRPGNVNRPNTNTNTNTNTNPSPNTNVDRPGGFNRPTNVYRPNTNTNTNTNTNPSPNTNVDRPGGFNRPSDANRPNTNTNTNTNSNPAPNTNVDRPGGFNRPANVEQTPPPRRPNFERPANNNPPPATPVRSAPVERATPEVRREQRTERNQERQEKKDNRKEDKKRPEQ